MKKGQVFVRARLLTEKRSGMPPVIRWVNADVFDLDQESFKVFVMAVLFKNGLVVGIKGDSVIGDDIVFDIADEHYGKYLKKLEEKNQ